MFYDHGGPSPRSNVYFINGPCGGLESWRFNGIPEARLNKQVEALQILDAEIVALVELNPVNTLDRLKTLLNEAGGCYDASVIDQEAELDIGVLFKCGVTAINPRLIDGSDLGVTTHRKAFVVNMKVGKFDFLLIVVHLKSGRGAAEQGIRDQQAAIISHFINSELTERPRQDIILLGDFNMIPGQDVSNFHILGGDDKMDFLSSWDLQDRFSHILEAGRANLLDGFAITRTFTTEYIRGSLRVFPVHWAMDIGLERFRETVSDHLPFITGFRIDRDLD